MKSRMLVVITLALPATALAFGASACGSGATSRTPTPSTAAIATTPSVTASPGSMAGTTTPAPTRTPATPIIAPGITPSPTVEPDRKVVIAPIDKLELITRESQPPQYAVHITSGLPDGCSTFHEARITARSGTTITITVTNTHPSDPMIACTAIYGEHDETVELGSDFKRGTAYTVQVNDKSLRFTAR